MKKLLCLLTFLIAVQTNASHYDVIYRFENQTADSDEYFVIKVDFDYVAPDDLVATYQQQVFSYEQFVELASFQGDFVPAFLFEIAIIDTNMSLDPTETLYGSTSLTATIQPMSTSLRLGESTFFRTNYQPVDPLYFSTGWELGQTVFQPGGFEDNFILTEITPVPLPAALPLLGFSLVLLGRSKREYHNTPGD